MDKNYNDVEITDEEMESLNDPIVSEISTDSVKTETTASQKETTQDESSSEVNESNVVEDEFRGVEIDGTQYDLDTIKNWMDDSANKEEWQKSNTQKAQDLSKWGKFVEKINKDDDLRNHIKDFYFDNPDEVKRLGLDGKIGLELEDADTSEPRTALEQRLELLEGFENDRIIESRVNILDSDLTKLETNFPEYLGESDQVSQFLAFAEQNGERFVVNGLPSLEKAFKEWSYDQMQDELSHYKKLGNNSNRNQGRVVNTSQVGAKEVKSPKKLSNWNDMTMDDPEIAKYFEE